MTARPAQELPALAVEEHPTGVDWASRLPARTRPSRGRPAIGARGIPPVPGTTSLVGDKGWEMDTLESAVRAEIRYRLACRRWYRANRSWANDAFWTRAAADNAAGLRALIRVARKARTGRVPAAFLTDWTEAEKREAWGR